YIEQLDRKVKSFTDAGINLSLIILNAVPSAPDPDNPLIHPLTDLKNAPFHLGAFNVDEEKGLLFYRGIIEYLANRYSLPDAKYGHVTGFIVGNEVNAHYTWYNIGRMPVEEFTERYHRVLRITQLAAHKFHSRLRVYASLEHHWNIRFSNSQESFRGKEFIDALNDLSKREGDFPWHIAFHPYPEDLFDPRVWEDKTALLCFDSPRITFKNLEVLAAYLAQEQFLYKNEPRRVILSEQGFHWDGAPEGEKIQAAAFAYAFFKVSHIPGIDAFMYYRHVSSKHEFGLRLGMYAGDTENPDEKGKGRMLFLHDVFREAGTAGWEKAFAFAKPIIGINSWDEVLPETDATTFTQSCISFPVEESALMVFDLAEKMADVIPTNCLSWRPEHFFDAVGYRPGIFHHPPDTGCSDAVFTLSLPGIEQGRNLVMKFDTAFTHESDDGVRFSVLLDGRELWFHKQKKIEPAPHKINLTNWAGKKVALTLRVDPLQNSKYDWSVWVWPRIVFELP
ncbi:hypothetical protein JW926_16325, partial [Candidatus Sumerlaeota bacterium]|nr:hypothetical protein [Candidatus Sumerlaeota bacterium]